MNQKNKDWKYYKFKVMKGRTILFRYTDVKDGKYINNQIYFKNEWIESEPLDIIVQEDDIPISKLDAFKIICGIKNG